MTRQVLVVIDLQNDITKNYREIIDSVNRAVDWAAGRGMHVVYIRHHNLSEGTRTFKPGTRGAEPVPSEEFAAFLRRHGVTECFLTGADATACVKSTAYNLARAGYAVRVLSDCVTSYDKTKIPEMLRYYESRGCAVRTLSEAMREMDGEA